MNKLLKFGNILSLSLLLCAAAATPCLADGLAAAPVGGAAGFDPNPFMLGWQFSVSTPVTVTGLAWLDATGGGLVESHMVGIFDSASGKTLVSAPIPSGTSVKYLNGFRVVPVNYTLAPGVYVVEGLRASNADAALVRASGVTTPSMITYMQERELKTSTFTFTSNTLDLNEKGSFGPSFTIAEATGNNSITGVTNSASFQSTFSPGSYVSIFGSNLSQTSRTWASGDFTNGTGLPTQLDGITATVNSTPAYVEYVSPTQLNIIVPNLTTTGPGAAVVIKRVGLPDITTWIDVEPIAPALFTWLTGTSDSGKYVVAQHADYTNVGKSGLFPQQSGTFTTAAKPGEIVILYGTGFGPTNPALPVGQMASQSYPLSPAPTATVGGAAAQIVYAGLVAGLSDVYQINLRLPAALPNGDLPVVITMGTSVASQSLITIQN